MLHNMINSGTERARKLTHARILLKADEGWTDDDICKAFDIGVAPWNAFASASFWKDWKQH